MLYDYFLNTMSSTSRDRSRVSAIFVHLVVASLLLFAVYLKAKPEGVNGSSDRTSSHLKIWADPNQSVDPKPRIILLWSIIILFAALFIRPDTCRSLGLVSLPEAAPPNLLLGSKRWSRPPPAALDLV